MAQKKGRKRSPYFLKWFFQTAASLPESEKRRSNLLSYLHLFLLVILIAAFFLVLATNPAGSPRRTEYHFLITVLTVIIGLAYALNRTGHYLTSAIATVLCAFAGPWGSIFLDPLILKGDFVPLTLRDDLGAAVRHPAHAPGYHFIGCMPIDLAGLCTQVHGWA